MRKTHKIGGTNIFLTVLLFLVTLSAPYWVPHDPYLQNLDLALQAPNAEYPFGLYHRFVPLVYDGDDRL